MEKDTGKKPPTDLGDVVRRLNAIQASNDTVTPAPSSPTYVDPQRETIRKKLEELGKTPQTVGIILNLYDIMEKWKREHPHVAQYHWGPDNAPSEARTVVLLTRSEALLREAGYTGPISPPLYRRMPTQTTPAAKPVVPSYQK